MDILYEALIKYTINVQNNIEYFSITNDFDEAIISYNLTKLYTSYNNINMLINIININIENNIMDLTVKERNRFFKFYNLSDEDIDFIKKTMRTIKNKFYQRITRIRKLIILD